MRCPRSILILALLLNTARVSFAQSTTPSDSTIAGNAYINFYFRFRYEFTASWIPLMNASKEQVHEFNLDGIATSCLHPEHDAATVGAQDLLMLLRKFPKTLQQADRYAAILAMAEKLPSDSGVRNGKECLLKLSEYLQANGYSAAGIPTEFEIGERTFTRQNLKGITRTGALYESLVYTTLKGYAVGFILIAPNEQILESTANTLKKLSFF